MKLQLGNVLKENKEFIDRLELYGIELNFEFPKKFKSIDEVNLFFGYIIEDILSEKIPVKIFDYNFDEIMGLNHILGHLNIQDVAINFYATNIENNWKSINGEEYTDMFNYSSYGRKIKFQYFSKILNQNTSERLWCKLIDEEKQIYQIDNIPFFGMNFSMGDKITVFEIEGDGMMLEKLYERSGNSTSFLVLEEHIDKDKFLKNLQFNNFEFELINSRFITINIDYDKNINEFIQLMKKINIEEKCFSFSHLSEKHNKEIL